MRLWVGMADKARSSQGVRRCNCSLYGWRSRLKLTSSTIISLRACRYPQFLKKGVIIILKLLHYFQCVVGPKPAHLKNLDPVVDDRMRIATVLFLKTTIRSVGGNVKKGQSVSIAPK
ncbi:hypothetical protein [Chamaesiphon sp. VAR_48_metabat_403]|uniref:hypothetical protein n=1 Tax=Chamaesiphon sp. VAR_48_metabat_403 TaxID=2964700 RepID=UPI00286EA850|nr:hypothetical protein [Chamaesiphon sp. VAR_48_metabat_403]